MSEIKTAEDYLYKKRLEEEVNLYSYKGETYIKKDFHDKQNQELQSKMFTWEKDYLDLQLRNQELKRQVEELTNKNILIKNRLDFWLNASDQECLSIIELHLKYTQIKEAADEYYNATDNLCKIICLGYSNEELLKAVNKLTEASTNYKQLTNKQ